MDKTLKRHPLSEICGPMDPDVYMALSASVAEVGVEDDIVLWQGMVLDGWNRYQAYLAAIALGATIKCPSKVFHGSAAEAVALVKRKQLRRDWTAIQRAKKGVELDEWERAQSAPGAPSGKSGAEIARETGTSDRTVDQARTILRRGIPELNAKVDDGEMSGKQGERIARLPRAEQKKALRTPAPAPAARPKWSAPPGRVPRIEVGASKEEADELRLAITTLKEALDESEAARAVHFMEGTDEQKLEWSVRDAEHVARIKTLEAELSAVKGSRNHYMEECNELKRQCNIYRGQLAKKAA